MLIKELGFVMKRQRVDYVVWTKSLKVIQV
jgi:hypothetical protein